ncbi:MAG: hypothetical protein HYT85_10865 [candidate division NC10 bacterium]|nr:hypothetical protein [candidate division NC10 bacterium]MBI2456953.1 hypothetical protein [candidate division NC10 bacterium]
MGKETYVRDESGKATHVRVTSDDGRTSWLYEADNSISGQLFHSGRGKCVEVAEHYPDGTTRAYEHDGSILGELFSGGKGKEK